MSYAKLAAAHKQNKGFRPPEGMYSLRFKNWSMPVSKTAASLGKPYFKLEFKVIAAPDADTLAKFQATNKLVHVKFFPWASYSFGNFLEFIEGLGVNLGAIRDSEQDPNMEDFKNILDAAEKKAPDMKGKVKPQEDSDMYYNLDLSEIEPIFAQPEQPAATQAYTPQPITPAPVANTAPAPVEPVAPVEQVAPATQAQAPVQEAPAPVTPGANW